MKKMNCEAQMALIYKIQEMHFVVEELMLYLDTHPCDTSALNDYNCAVDSLNAYKAEYEERYGSISEDGHHGQDKWNWLDSPWPWEM